MTHCFDVVSVGTDDEGTVVVWMVDGSDTGWPVVCCRRLCRKRDVHGLLRLLALTEPELRYAGAAKACPALDFLDERDAEWRKSFGEKSLAARVVAHGQTDVV